MASKWLDVETVPPLGCFRIHFWRIPVQMHNACCFPRLDLLAEDERRRAETFHCLPDRYRFVTGRSALRVLIAQYLRADPKSLRFGYGFAGKPFLICNPDLRFNLSHSGRWIVVAVAWNIELGVDLERVSNVPEWHTLSLKYFGPTERRFIQAAPYRLRMRLFHECWVCKEAYLKMRGSGLIDELSKIEFHPKLGSYHRQREVERQITVHLAAPSATYTCALIANSPCAAIDLWNLPIGN